MFPARRRVGTPRINKSIQRVEAAKVSRFAQGAVQSRDVGGAHRLTGRSRESQVRRAQQRDGGNTGEVGADEREQQIDGGRVRLGGKRKGDDIWVAAPNTGGQHGASPSVTRFASLTDCDAEPTGIYYDLTSSRLFVNIQHPGVTLAVTGDWKTLTA